MPFCLLVGILSVYTPCIAQEKPPRPILISVSTAQHLSFGTIIQAGTYGTVTVTYDGARSATGSIILPNMYSIITPALFIVDAEPGTLITINNGPPATLIGSHGGSLTLTIGEASTRSPFIARTKYTDVYIGGTLEVESLLADPAGFYSGTFQVTFIQQ